MKTEILRFVREHITGDVRFQRLSDVEQSKAIEMVAQAIVVALEGALPIALGSHIEVRSREKRPKERK